MQPTHIDGICQVCGDCALITNYGALSCLPCRTFFRRNASHPEELRPCRSRGHCEVNIITRKFCPTCRLKKCFIVGMSADFIRKEELSSRKRKFSSSNNLQWNVVRISAESAFDRLADGNQLGLNNRDRILISNIVHAFDAFSPKSQIEHAINYVTKSTSNRQDNLPQSIQLMFSCFNCMHSFISSTPDFKILTLNEQRSLLRRNFLGILIGSALPISQESRLFEKPENELVFSLIYGSKITQQVRFMLRQIDFDPIILKLILMALAFSSSCYMIDYQGNTNEDSLLLGTFRLLGSQNVYVELLWKFLLVKYGFIRSVQILSNLTKQLLKAYSLSMEAYGSNQIHKIFLDNVVKQAELFSINNERVYIPLWGKQI